MCIRDRDKVSTVDKSSEYLILVNKTHGLGKNYEPEDLKNVNSVAAVSYTHLDVYKRQVMNVSDNRLSITTYDASTGEQLENSSTYTIIKEEKTPTAPAKETYDISKAVVSGIKDKTYNGKKQTQSITVKYNGKTLAANKDYTVSYSNNKKMGTASVTITGKGDYQGTVKKTFKIRPKKPIEMCIRDRCYYRRRSKIHGNNSGRCGRYAV